MRKLCSIMTAVAAAALATPATAATLWLDSDNTAYGGDYASGTSLLFSSGGVNVRVSGWSLHDGNLYQASLGVWSGGLGVSNGSGDNSHTVDNSGYLDFLVFQFDQLVELDLARFNTGWHGMNDTDATIGYDTNAISFASAPLWNGVPLAQLAIFDQYVSAAASGNSTRDINPGNTTGTMWLIGAAFANPDGNLDGFKLEKLTFTRAVPEPATWAMLLAGFFALGGALRVARRSPRTGPGSPVQRIAG